MSHHAYIDESGTNDDEVVMTVAMVILEGARSAEKLRSGILKSLFKTLTKMRKIRQQKQLKEQELHYADMKDSHKVITGVHLSKARINCYLSCYWHDGNQKNYETRFAIYTQLVKNCINQAFENHIDIAVTIAKQGGWQIYKQSFLADLSAIPKQFVKLGKFRKGKFELASATHPGIQIADFYASAGRDFLRSQSNSTLAFSYELVKHQIMWQICEVDTNSKR